jgi:signal transduction histidine kinase
VNWRAVGRHGEVLVALVAAVLFVVQTFTQAGFAGDRPAALAIAGGFCVALTFVRRAPLVPLIAGAALMAASNKWAPALANTGTFFLAYVLASYMAGRHLRGRSLIAAVAVLTIAFPLAAIEPGQPFSVSDGAFIAVALAGPFIGGYVIRRRHEMERSLRGRAAQLEAERDLRAREAVAEERVRIARELHDVVAHAISVMVLLARGGRHRLPAGADETREALDEIERTAEDALSEMRRLLGMLRRPDDDAELAPQPGLRDIEKLAASVSATGLPVDVSVEGAPRELPAGVEVSAYRIVQEALTNALKHAGPANAHVTVRYMPAEVELEIVDDGTGSANGGGTGQGLAGLRERVAIYGGELTAGRRPEGGFAVRARLPVKS